MSSALEIAKAAGHVNISSGGSGARETLELSVESRRERDAYEASIRAVAINKRARAINAPTAVEDVQKQLRLHRQPVTLFAENAFDRRERLKKVLATLELENEGKGVLGGSDGSGTGTVRDKKKDEMGEGAGDKTGEMARVTYSEALPDMVLAREFISKYSFESARERVKKEASKVNEQEEHYEKVCQQARSLQLNASAVSEQRPLTKVRFDPSGSYVATGSLSSQVKIWDIKALKSCASLMGHQERITALAWHPKAILGTLSTQSGGHGGGTQDGGASKPANGSKKRSRSYSNDNCQGKSSSSVSDVSDGEGKALLASASADAKCLLWDVSLASNTGTGSLPTLSPVQTLQGHRGSITDCTFHPAGAHIATSGVDFSWRFWDVEAGKEVLLQDGHPSECTSVSFQSDGSLLVSADSSGYVFLWDLRSGKRILVLEGHAEKVTSTSFHPNGFEIASASLDNMVRVWDIRKMGCKYQLPSHSQPITQVRYSKSGAMLLTASFDSVMKVYSTLVQNGNINMACYPKLSTLRGHSGKVMAADISPAEDAVVSVGFDRTLKVWRCDA